MTPVFDPDLPQEHHMQFKPKTQKEITEEMLAPAGDYDFEVTKAEDKVSKAGNPMIALNIKIFMPNGSQRFVKDWLMEKMSFKLRHWAYATGLGAKYEAGEMTAEDCVGRTGRLKLVVQEAGGDFASQNSVKDYIVQDAAEKPAPTAAPKRQALPPAADDANEPPF